MSTSASAVVLNTEPQITDVSSDVLHLSGAAGKDSQFHHVKELATSIAEIMDLIYRNSEQPFMSPVSQNDAVDRSMTVKFCELCSQIIIILQDLCDFSQDYVMLIGRASKSTAELQELQVDLRQIIQLLQSNIERSLSKFDSLEGFYEALVAAEKCQGLREDKHDSLSESPGPIAEYLARARNHIGQLRPFWIECSDFLQNFLEGKAHRIPAQDVLANAQSYWQDYKQCLSDTLDSIRCSTDAAMVSPISTLKRSTGPPKPKVILNLVVQVARSAVPQKMTPTRRQANKGTESQDGDRVALGSASAIYEDLQSDGRIICSPHKVNSNDDVALMSPRVRKKDGVLSRIFGSSKRSDGIVGSAGDVTNTNDGCDLSLAAISTPLLNGFKGPHSHSFGKATIGQL